MHTANVLHPTVPTQHTPLAPTMHIPKKLGMVTGEGNAGVGEGDTLLDGMSRMGFDMTVVIRHILQIKHPSIFLQINKYYFEYRVQDINCLWENMRSV